MCKKTVYLLSFVLVLGSVSNAEDIAWTDLGADHLWSNPDNWDLGRVPTLADEVKIDVPAAAAPNGPVIQDGIAAEALGIWTEAAGEPTLTITGGSLVVAEWIWCGDGADSFGVWTISGGTVDVADEFELGWDGGAGTLTVTGGTINAGKAVIPTGSGAFGELFLQGGTYSVTKPDGLQVNANGLIDITEGTLVLEGDDTTKVNDLIAAGQITAYGGTGLLKLDYDQSSPGKTTLTAVARVTLFAEDFEGLPLGPNVDEALAGNAVWTDTPPEGWTVDESSIPGIGNPATDGVTEWAGWAFADKAWWTEAAEDQNRSQFVLASGTVAVADPDEWDDADRLPIPISADPYDTWLTTPAIDVFGLEAGTLQLKFDSSWRPEFDDNYHQTASITASFDGGEPVTVLLWESDGNSENFKPDSTNETVVVDLDIPKGAASVVLEFGLTDAGNDWWWAIDNVQVSGVPREKIVVLSEDFEGLALGPNVDESLAGDQVWTDTPPEGWAIDESGIPGIGDPATDGVTEWAGWALADKAWWTEAAEDQNRSQFVLASGTVAVADPDEWDDADHADAAAAGWYKTFLSTPEIDISALEAGSLQLTFASSWRPEFDSNYHQTANITASFDGGEPVEVLLWESDGGSENFKPDSTNETVVVRVPNPAGAKSVVLEFGLFDAGNDWWWAIDNVEVSGIPLPEPVDPSTDGLVAFYALDGDANDASGNGNDGTISNLNGGLGLDGSVWVDDPERGTVISFNGTAEGAFVRAGDIPQMTLTNDFVWAFWAKHSDENTADNDIILGNRKDENAVDFVPRQFIKFTPTKFEWHMNGNGDDNLDYDDIVADVWFHHAVVKTADQLTYYRNGAEASSGTFTQPLDFPQPLYFGGDNEGSAGENWAGLMSDVRIYDRALSAGEIRYLAGH